jgi:hypothetical protein
MVDSSTQPEGYEFSVQKGNQNISNPNQIESIAVSQNRKVVTVLFENTNPQDNIVFFMYSEAYIHSKDDKDVQLQCTFNTSSGTFTTNVSHLFSEKYPHKIDK